jgi:hypothetical protein
VVAARTTLSGSPEPDKGFDENVEREALRRHKRPQPPDHEQAQVLGDDDAAAVAAMAVLAGRNLQARRCSPLLPPSRKVNRSMSEPRSAAP